MAKHMNYSATHFGRSSKDKHFKTKYIGRHIADNSAKKVYFEQNLSKNKYGKKHARYSSITKYDIPSTSQLEAELAFEKHKKRNGSPLKKGVFLLVTVSAVAVLFTTMLMPVFKIYGSSMTPCVNEGDIVVSIKGNDFNRGDIVSFYYNNKILVKRIVAFEGEWVNLDDDGNIYVNDKLLDEPYLSEKSLGICDIELPYQVPDGELFVCGDHRSTSVDSRSSTIGCVSEEQLVGKILFCVWPPDDFGGIK